MSPELRLSSLNGKQGQIPGRVMTRASFWTGKRSHLLVSASGSLCVTHVLFVTTQLSVDFSRCAPHR